MLLLVVTTVLTVGVAVPVRAQEHPQRIEALAPADALALRPLADRGAAALVYFPDGGPDARVTVMIPVHAPMAVVHDVLVNAAAWPSFIPAFTSVEALSRAGSRTAYRFTAAGPMLDVQALCTLHDVSPRRVDLSIPESAFGPSGARWDLTAESPDTTLVTVTSWSDPSQGHWLLRRAAASNPSATAGMNLAVDLSLAIAVARRAAAVHGATIPSRPPPPLSPPPGPLTPPPPGPWIALNPQYYVVAFSFTPAGSVDEITLTGQTWAPPERVLARVQDVGGYASHIPGIRDTHPTGVPDHFTLGMSSAWDHGAGEVVRLEGPGDTVRVSGVSGTVQDLRWRWDVTHDPQRGTLLWFTGGVEQGVDTLLTGIAAAREPLLVPGLSALRKLVWLRYMLNGV